MDDKGGAWMRKRMMSGSVKGMWGEATMNFINNSSNTSSSNTRDSLLHNCHVSIT